METTFQNPAEEKEKAIKGLHSEITKVYHEKENVTGKVCLWSESNAQVAQLESGAYAGKYKEIPLDPSLRAFANSKNMSVAEYLEQLDPSDAYEDQRMSEIGALGRQLVRVGIEGLLPTKHNEPRRQKSMEFVMANTPANALLFPEMVKTSLFWDPLPDLEFDPNVLLAATVSQTEEMTKAIIVDDSAMRHRRSTQLGEGATIPTDTLRFSGYASGVRKYGAGYAYSIEFAKRTPYDLFAQALVRMGMRERRALFDHILSVFVNGDRVYGIAAGATKTPAAFYDSDGITETQELTFVSWSRYLYARRPYAPTLVVCNVNTSLQFIGAVPPANVTNAAIIQLLQRHKYPDMPVASNPAFLGNTPPMLVVPNDALADNLILTLNVPAALNRVVIQGGEIDEDYYSAETQMYKRFFTIKDGLFPHPSFNDAAHILNTGELS